MIKNQLEAQKVTPLTSLVVHVQRLNYKTLNQQKMIASQLVYTEQQSFESIEARHMQNAWQPVNGYLRNKHMNQLSMERLIFYTVIHINYRLNTGNPSHILTSQPFLAAGLSAFHFPDNSYKSQHPKPIDMNKLSSIGERCSHIVDTQTRT